MFDPDRRGFRNQARLAHPDLSSSRIGLLVLSMALFAGCTDDDQMRPPVDTTPPAAVTNLSVVSVTDSSATLGWTAPGDDGDTTGTAQAYEIRRSMTTITEANWAAATQEPSSPTPRAGGSAETFVVRGLSVGTFYFFALKTLDDAENRSGLSNVASGTTTVGGAGFVLVRPGTFIMGSSKTEPGGLSYRTQHAVSLTKAFYVSTTEVTQSDWQAVMGWNESSFQGADRPVENVNWYDGVSYCNQRSTRVGPTPAYTISNAVYDGNHIRRATVTWNQSVNGYRLLTESEWEYACRATSQTAFCNGELADPLVCSPLDPNLDLVGWYCGNANDATHDVGLKAANAWGLKDMHGNVTEWCWDCWGTYPTGPVTDPVGPASGSHRIWRGGNWGDYPQFCRSSMRLCNLPGRGYNQLGLRLARTAP